MHSYVVLGAGIELTIMVVGVSDLAGQTCKQHPACCAQERSPRLLTAVPVWALLVFEQRNELLSIPSYRLQRLQKEFPGKITGLIRTISDRLYGRRVRQLPSERSFETSPSGSVKITRKGIGDDELR